MPDITDAGAAAPEPLRSRGLRADLESSAVDGGTRLRSALGRWRIGGLAGPAREVVKSLIKTPLDEASLHHALDGDAAALAAVRRVLDGLPWLVTHSVADVRGTLLATATPVNRTARLLERRRLDPHSPAPLSRFALLRRLPDAPSGAGGFVLESPVSAYRVELLTVRACGFVGALALGRPVAQAAADASLTAAEGSALASLLAELDLLENPGGSAGHGRAEMLPMWEFHDLLFHHRSRYGLHDYAGGGNYAHADSRPAPPALPDPSPLDGPGIDLPIPDWDAVLDRDATLTEVLEGRRSVRRYDADSPVTLEQLGELLYRAARVRAVHERDKSDPLSYASVDRPYPGGGGMGELEIFLAVERCAGLAPGIYRYDSAGHRLHPRSDDASRRAEMFAYAVKSTGGTLSHPQVLFTVTSRFDRLAWKYSAISYAVTLKHVGVLFQTLYLVATAMGLSPCGLGSGSSEAAARALGLDWIAQPAVGEFALGGKPADTSERGAGFSDVTAWAGRRGA